MSLTALPFVAALSCWAAVSLDCTAGDTIGVTTATSLGHVAGSFLLNPDLDYHSRPYTRWLWLRFIWLPHRWMMSHRSFLSHGPVVGTAFRLFYLSFWLAWPLLWYWCGAAWWYGRHRPELWGEWNVSFWFRLTLVWSWLTVRHPEWTLAFVAGLEFGAMLHVVADYTVSAWKRTTTRFWPRRGAILRRSRED